VFGDTHAHTPPPTMFSLADASLIITGILFVFWQWHAMDAKSIMWYMNKRETHLPRMLRLPPAVFGIVWTMLHAMQVAFLVLYVGYSVSTDHWTFPLTYTLFVVGVLMQKLWSVLFFRARRTSAALVVCTILLAMGITVTAVVGADHSNLGGGDGVWITLLVFYVLYTAWLAFACLLNGFWVGKQQ
jgi:tryptophan-rich sensory protein